MDKRLIINADGYGFTEGVNRGIEEAVENGVVTSISVNANFEPVWALKNFIARNPRVSVGVHLNPVVGRPIAKPSEVPTLVGDKGTFHHHAFVPRLKEGLIDLHELSHEMSLQIERTQSLVTTVTHLDSHQHSHLRGQFFGVFVDLCKKFNITRMRTNNRRVCAEFDNRFSHVVGLYARHPMRAVGHAYTKWLMGRARAEGLRMADWFLTVGKQNGAGVRTTAEGWRAIIRNCPMGTSEILCHPGYVCDELRRWADVIVEEREQERRALTDPAVREAFQNYNVQPISFYDL